MGFFDFFKNKNTDVPENDQPIEGMIEVGGLTVESGQETDEIVLHIDEALNEADPTAALNIAVHEVMDDEEISIDRASADTLYQEGRKKDKNDAENSVAEGTLADVQATEAIEDTVEEPQEEILMDEAMTADSITDEAIEETEEITEEFEINGDVESEPENAPAEEKKLGFFARLKEGLDKTRNNIMGGVDSVLGAFTKIDEELFEELEEALIMADMGVETTMNIVENLRKRVKREHTTEPSQIKGMLIDEITAILSNGEDEENLPSPSVMLVIGVNGVGKTTTIGKLSYLYKEEGRKVLLAAADTFRAAAIDQLEIWGERSGIEVIKQAENSDPAAVVFDAVHAARNQESDLLICDTAGRLHNKKNLMEELRKIAKVIEREYPQAHREVYLVLDATTGQNALQQAKVFQEVADITGIILTKLDGTAKGGIVVAIKNELKIPVRYIGVGEGIHDLQKFNASEFARALFGE